MDQDTSFLFFICNNMRVCLIYKNHSGWSLVSIFIKEMVKILHVSVEKIFISKVEILENPGFVCCQAHWGLPVGFCLLCIRFYVLLSPYLYFISFLYLDLYVLGDDAWISYVSFM